MLLKLGCHVPDKNMVKCTPPPNVPETFPVINTKTRASEQLCDDPTIFPYRNTIVSLQETAGEER